MIIYKDIFTEDEIISDNFKLIDAPGPSGSVLWEVDCRKYVKGKEDIKLEGANPSAEGGDDGGDDGTPGVMVHDIEDVFRLVWLKPDENGMETKPSKEDFKSYLRSYIGKLNKKLVEKETSEEGLKEFQTGARAAMKKILANYDNYDVLMGESMGSKGMYVLIDFRDDGMTPYATIWKHGVFENKV